MECYYHPGRESSENCAICGKSICKECGLEIAGKTYCKDCLEKIVGLGIENKVSSPSQNEEYVDANRVEPTRLEKRPITETIYESQNDVPNSEIGQIRDDSPYNIHPSSNGSEYASTPSRQPQVDQNEYGAYSEQELREKINSQDYIYPEHSDAARSDLEDKYERYLDDLYYDENEIPLEEQLAKDEAQYGSLTRRTYHPRTEEALLREKAAEKPKFETPEEMEARIRAEILAEKEGGKKIKDQNIHNLNYQEEKEPRSAVDILLTIVLILVILVVIYYIIYILVLHATYPTFIESIYALSNPQNVINSALNPPPTQ